MELNNIDYHIDRAQILIAYRPYSDPPSQIIGCTGQVGVCTVQYTMAGRAYRPLGRTVQNISICMLHVTCG